MYCLIIKYLRLHYLLGPNLKSKSQFLKENPNTVHFFGFKFYRSAQKLKSLQNHRFWENKIQGHLVLYCNKDFHLQLNESWAKLWTFT